MIIINRNIPLCSRTWSNRKEIKKSDKERWKNWKRSRQGGKNAVRGYDSPDGRDKRDR